jgi:signal recognition particle receptor subunit beta
MAVRPMTVSLTASHRVRATDWFQASASVPVTVACGDLDVPYLESASTVAQLIRSAVTEG